MPSRSRLKLWRSLLRRKGREAAGLFLAEGRRLVEELLEARVEVEAVVCTEAAASDPGVEALLERARGVGAAVERVSERTFGELADTATPQGLLAVGRTPDRGWRHVVGPRILVLDAVRDPGNLGTLVRTAEALGLGGVVCLPGTVDPWNPKALRAAAGAAFRVPLVQSALHELLGELDARGAALWAADAAGEPFRRGDAAPERLALALGNEAHGVSEPVRQAARRLVAVRMAGRVESLNVAVAGAILMDRAFGAAEETG